jgi:hypothetical protein
MGRGTISQVVGTKRQELQAQVNWGGDMAIDSRVAHGIAGRHLQDALKSSIEVMERVRKSICRRSTRPATAKGARRELREIRGAVACHSLWYAEGEDRHDGPWLSWFGARSYGEEGERCLHLARYRLAPAAQRVNPVQSDFVASLRLHAVARCLQRNDTLSWADVKPILADATAYSVLMAEVCRVASLPQLAVQAGDGLFVGGTDEDGDPYLETYLKLDEAQPSRWAPVRMAQLISMVEFGLRQEDVYAMAAYSFVDGWDSAVEQLGGALSGFKWLTEQDQPKLDPLSVAWNDFRNQRAA